jgi:hypothetical protein
MLLSASSWLPSAILMTSLKTAGDAGPRSTRSPKKMTRRPYVFGIRGLVVGPADQCPDPPGQRRIVRQLVDPGHRVRQAGVGLAAADPGDGGMDPADALAATLPARSWQGVGRREVTAPHAPRVPAARPHALRHLRTQDATTASRTTDACSSASTRPRTRSSTPPTASLREELLLPQLDEWLSRKFDPIALASTRARTRSSPGRRAEAGRGGGTRDRRVRYQATAAQGGTRGRGRSRARHDVDE